jgi:undecaprenyl-diphosphatase
MLRRAALLLALAGAGGSPVALAGIDHKVPYDDSGIWSRSVQTALINGLIAAEVGGALWQGGEDRLGLTLWRSVDATLVGGASEIALKYIFSRERPSQTDDPNRWFTGHGQSFPSGEVTVTSAIVTPFILEYADEHPAVYALELIPLYDAIARVKVHAHWQTDVMAGWALGTATAYFMHGRPSPLVLSIMPHGIQIGLKMQF